MMIIVVSFFNSLIVRYVEYVGSDEAGTYILDILFPG